MRFGGDTYVVKCGTYQDREFGSRYFGYGERPMNPTGVLRPGRRKSEIPCSSGMQVFSDLSDAVEFPRLV